MAGLKEALLEAQVFGGVLSLDDLIYHRVRRSWRAMFIPYSKLGRTGTHDVGLGVEVIQRLISAARVA